MSATQRKLEATTVKANPWVLYDVTESDVPLVLPNNPSEISAFDHAHNVDAGMPDDTPRLLVYIRQDQWKLGQNPTDQREEMDHCLFGRRNDCYAELGVWIRHYD
jgi:hypothetical protein